MPTLVFADKGGARVIGKWKLNYDPDGVKTDWLEFLPNGDVWSVGGMGKVPGIYIVDGESVKAVFHARGKILSCCFTAIGPTVN